MIAVSSANVNTWVFRKLLGMLAVNKLYKVGDNTAPCGTPALILLTVDDWLIYITSNDRWLIKFDINLIWDGFIFMWIRFLISLLCHTVSNAFATSKKIALQHLLLVNALWIISDNLKACCSVECCNLNPYCVLLGIKSFLFISSCSLVSINYSLCYLR